MARERAFLVRGPGGTMATVMATSIRSAGELYRARERPSAGSTIAVKERGKGGWEHFKVKK